MTLSNHSGESASREFFEVPDVPPRKIKGNVICAQSSSADEFVRLLDTQSYEAQDFPWLDSIAGTFCLGGCLEVGGGRGSVGFVFNKDVHHPQPEPQAKAIIAAAGP